MPTTYSFKVQVPGLVFCYEQKEIKSTSSTVKRLVCFLAKVNGPNYIVLSLSSTPKYKALQSQFEALPYKELKKQLLLVLQAMK